MSQSLPRHAAREFSPQVFFSYVVVCLLIALYALVFSWLALQRYETLSIDNIDLGYLDQVVWNILHGRFFLSTIQVDMSTPPFTYPSAAYHFQPILVPISLLYLIRSSPETLLVLQSLLLGLGALPIFWLARDHLRSNLGGLALALAYLLLPAMGWANLTGFHSLSLTTTFLLFAFYFLQKRSYLGFLIFALLSLASREDASLFIALMGLYVLIVQKERKVGIWTVVASLGWFLLTTLLIIPYYTYCGTLEVFSHYEFLDGTYQSTLVFAVVIIFVVCVLGFLTVQLPQRFLVSRRATSYVLLGVVLICSGYYHYQAGASPLAKHYPDSIGATEIAAQSQLAEVLIKVTPATATPISPTPTPTPIICPLCGQVVQEPSALTFPPLSVKIDNAIGSRPQSGLSQACIVYEHLTEWGITRFNAIYFCQPPDNIGPIRSARLIDLDLVRQYKAVFAHVGACQPVMDLIQTSGLWDLDQFWYPYAYYRSDSRPAPYNVYNITPNMLEIVQAKGWQGPENLGHPFLFQAEPPPNGTPASRVEIPFSTYNPVEYRYNEGEGTYQRWVTGQPHVDADSGEQISIANVVVQWVNSWETDIFRDPLGARILEFELTGEGRAEVFRDGRVFPAHWVRHDPDEITKFLDGEGNPLPFKPGNIWIAVVPLDLEITIEG